MPADPNSDKFAWLLGREKYQRLYMQFWVITSVGYLLILLLLTLYAAPVELARKEHVWLVCGLVTTAVISFFVALRTGWSKRFKDPALTEAQMIFALLMVALVFVTSEKLRGTILMIPPLILLFGAFSLRPARCRLMGGLTVGLQIILILFLLMNAPPNGDLTTDWINFFIGALVNIMVSVFAARLSEMKDQLRTQKKALNLSLERNLLMVRQDSLTSLPNRRHAMELLVTEEQRALRQQVALCVCMLDIDHFKRINDSYGHAAGDDVLRLFSTNANAALRATDILTRWGGEEFLLLMPHTSTDEALRVIDRVRRQLVQPGLWREQPELQVTFSAGIAAYQADETIMQTVARADEALYAAKLNGRNCTVAATRDKAVT